MTRQGQGHCTIRVLGIFLLYPLFTFSYPLFGYMEGWGGRGQEKRA